MDLDLLAAMVELVLHQPFLELHLHIPVEVVGRLNLVGCKASAAQAAAGLLKLLLTEGMA